jgi:DNA topoisomerase-3
VKREHEIRAFVSKPYWLVHATFDPRYTGIWFEGKEPHLADMARANEIALKVTGKAGVVASIESKEQSEHAPLLYDLTSLQRDANRRFSRSMRKR